MSALSTASGQSPSVEVADPVTGVSGSGKDKLSLITCVGWGIGSAGMMTLLNVTNGLILKYVVDFLGITAILAGGLIAATRIFDAAIDPFIGTLSDKTSSRWGRRRPFLLVGSFLCAVAPIILFAVPQFFDPRFAVFSVVAGLIFYAISYTAYNVPYMAMPVEMTQDHHERTYLFSFRIYGMAIGGLAGGAAAPWFVTHFGGDAAAFAKMSYVIALMIFVGCITCFWLTKDAPVHNVTVSIDRPGFSDIRLVLRNHPFLLLLVAKVFLVCGTGVSAAALAFFVTKVLNQPLSLLGVFVAGSTIGLIGSQGFWLPVAKRLGKRVCFLVSASFYIIVVLSWLLAGPSEPQFVLGIRAVLLGAFGGGILLSSQAMLPDCLEHEYHLTGIRHEGAMTGLYTTIERGASAVGVALAGAILSLGGYVAGAETISDDAVQAIYICIAVVPAVMLSISIAAIFKYDLPG